MFIEGHQFLVDLEEKNFKPHPFYHTGFSQTMMGAFLPNGKKLEPNEALKVDLGDDDSLLVNCMNCRAKAPIVVLIHGLTGSSDSGYILRITRDFVSQGVGVAQINLRNAGLGFGWSKKPYHAGLTNDLKIVLDHLQRKFNPQGIYAAGFSLGGNLLLKYLGESGKESGVKAAMVVSPPIDLHLSSKKISKNRPLDGYFVARLRVLLKKMAEVHHTWNVDLPKKLTLIDFDGIFTAPQCGFRDVEDYYTQASCAPLLKEIKTPTTILSSIDDPCIDSHSLLQYPRSSDVDLILTKFGGHLGFLSKKNGLRPLRWMDYVVVSLLRQAMPREEFI